MIEKKFRTRLTQASEQIAADFPSVFVRLASYGPLTNNRSHGLAIECLLREAQSENEISIGTGQAQQRMNG